MPRTPGRIYVDGHRLPAPKGALVVTEKARTERDYAAETSQEPVWFHREQPEYLFRRGLIITDDQGSLWHIQASDGGLKITGLSHRASYTEGMTIFPGVSNSVLLKHMESRRG